CLLYQCQVVDSIISDTAAGDRKAARVSTYIIPRLCWKLPVIRAMTDTLDRGRDADAVDEWPFKTLTPEEAQALRAKLPMLSPWRVVAAQAVAGVLCCAVVWAITRRGSAAWSALYGAAAVVLPGMLLAR